MAQLLIPHPIPPPEQRDLHGSSHALTSAFILEAKSLPCGLWWAQIQRTGNIFGKKLVAGPLRWHLPPWLEGFELLGFINLIGCLHSHITDSFLQKQISARYCCLLLPTPSFLQSRGRGKMRPWEEYGKRKRVKSVGIKDRQGRRRNDLSPLVPILNLIQLPSQAPSQVDPGRGN